MSPGKVLLGALGLIAGGAIVGVLFAPAKGKHTRKRIVSSTADYGDDLKNKVEELMENINDAADMVKDEADKLTKNLKR